MESDPNQNPKLSLEQQIGLAQQLLATVAARDEFPNRFGGFDEFSDVHQYVGDNRKQYDELWASYMTARKEFEEKVTDIKAVVESLRETDKKSGDMIAMMFSVK